MCCNGPASLSTTVRDGSPLTVTSRAELGMIGGLDKPSGAGHDWRTGLAERSGASLADWTVPTHGFCAGLRIVCALFAHCLRTVCALFAQCLRSVCAVFAQIYFFAGLRSEYVVCAMFAQCLRSVCAMFAQCLRNVYAMFAHFLRNVCAMFAQR